MPFGPPLYCLRRHRPCRAAKGAAIISTIVLLAACPHRTRVESNPPGAKLYVEGEYICITPCYYERPTFELEEHTSIRLERSGYRPTYGELGTAVLPSRVIGGIFTLGISMAFKSPHTYLSRQSFNLLPLTNADRLRQLDAMRSRGEIGEAEYETLRLDVLRRP